MYMYICVCVYINVSLNTGVISYDESWLGKLEFICRAFAELRAHNSLCVTPGKTCEKKKREIRT